MLLSFDSKGACCPPGPGRREEGGQAWGRVPLAARPSGRACPTSSAAC